jgi:hypothetical protein
MWIQSEPCPGVHPKALSQKYDVYLLDFHLARVKARVEPGTENVEGLL